MKTNRRTEKKMGGVFMENSCPNCGKSMHETKGSLSFPVNGEDVVVPNSSHLLCKKCGETLLRLDESRRLREGAIDRYREKHDLLSAEDVRSLRERLSLTQSELAELLRLGVNTLSRWESGRNVQTAAMDVLLRLIRDVPGSIEYLRKWAA